MKVTCPECGAEIAAENINVQQLVAVCGTCNTVFRFDVTDPKRKRRKVKQPARVEMIEAPDRLMLRYQRVFNEEERGLDIGGYFMVLIMTGVMIAAIVYHAPVFISVFLAFLAVFSWYAEAAMLFNRTTISLGDDRLAVDYGPLPWMTGAGKNALDLHDVTEVTYEQTDQSRETASANRYYHVRARLRDGDTVTLLKGMPQEYAFYIAQELNAMIEDGAITESLDNIIAVEDEATIDPTSLEITEGEQLQKRG
jgi:lysine biosynthesis protein LysW